MKRKVALVLLSIILMFFISACSSSKSDQNSDGEDQDQSKVQSESSANKEMSTDDSFAVDYNDDSAAEDEQVAVGESDEINTTRMIIHTAQLDIRVKDFNKTQLDIEKKVNTYDGYVVESGVYRESDEHTSGHMTVRVPAKNFQKFLADTEEQAVEVLSRDVSGQDVTEQYVDLESRLKSKRVVEERLLSFMNDAEKTEDLLQISTDLATIQEDIEIIVGKMNYLENQSAYSTIEISMHESRVLVPEIDNKDLDTWEKTKKQFVESINFILKVGSALIVFFIGNLPMIMFLLVIGVVVYLIIRRRNKLE